MKSKRSFIQLFGLVIIPGVALLVTIGTFILKNKNKPKDFKLVVKPIELTVQQGGTITSTVNVETIGNYTNEVYLSAKNVNKKIELYFENQSITAPYVAPSVMTINVENNVKPQKYTINIRGTGAEGISRNCSLFLTVSPKPLTKTFINDLFIPSGYMGDYEDIILDNKYKMNVHSGNSCIKIQYLGNKTQNRGWAGIYWQYPENNWGDKNGKNLSGAVRLIFWARGEIGTEVAEFKTGGIEGKVSDSMGGPYSTGKLTLSNEWKEYSIDLNGRDLNNVIGAFCWVTSFDDNPNGCTIYLDDMYFE